MCDGYVVVWGWFATQLELPIELPNRNVKRDCEAEEEGILVKIIKSDFALPLQPTGCVSL